jgi:hypothetical protein
VKSNSSLCSPRFLIFTPGQNSPTCRPRRSIYAPLQGVGIGVRNIGIPIRVYIGKDGSVSSSPSLCPGLPGAGPVRTRKQSGKNRKFSVYMIIIPFLTALRQLCAKGRLLHQPPSLLIFRRLPYRRGLPVAVYRIRPPLPGQI